MANMANMNSKNRLVIVREEFDDFRSCTVYGLDNDEGEEFCLSLPFEDEIHHTRIRPDQRNGLISLFNQRASKVFPILEKMGYELDNVSDNADIVTGYKVIVNWRFMKKN